MSRPTYMTINLQALKANLARVRELAPDRSVMAMVKANAYGHGIQRVALALEGADAFGVASLEEGLMLREAGITQPIVLMEGLFYQDELAEAAKHQFTLVVHHLPHVEMLEKVVLDHQFAVWLKINTGMHRLGVGHTEVDDIYLRLSKIPCIKKPIGLMTHFAAADALENVATHQQIQLFQQVTRHIAGPRSLSNSAGILGWPDAHGDWVRPGLMLYGASPISGKTGVDKGLKPVMTLWSRLIAVTQIKKGSSVGYSGTWQAPEDMLVGIVGVGYGDGYPQNAKNGTPVLVNGVRCGLAGRVSMDMLAVDLRNQPKAKVGDVVILWGDGLPVEEIAANSQASAYEILTRMTPRPKIQVV